MTPDNLRTAWDESSKSFSEYDTRTPLPRNTQTSLDRLVDRYRRFVIVAVLGIVMTPAWVLQLVHNSQFQLSLILVFVIYFLGAGLTDLWLYGRLKGLEITSAPLKTVLQQTALCKKTHLRSMIILIPYAICLIGFTMWVFRDLTYLIYGMITGVAVGLIFGIAAFMRFMADYKAIAQEYEI